MFKRKFHNLPIEEREKIRKRAKIAAHQSCPYPLTNAEFANQDKVFKTACELAGCQPTKRQASKFRNKVGKAFAHRQDAILVCAAEAG